MITTKSNGERESPWKIPLLMSTCQSFISPDVSTIFQLAVLLPINVMMFLAVPNMFKHFRIQESGTMLYAFLYSIHVVDRLVSLLRQFSRIVLSTSNWSFIPCDGFPSPFRSAPRSSSAASNPFLSKCI